MSKTALKPDIAALQFAKLVPDSQAASGLAFAERASIDVLQRTSILRSLEEISQLTGGYVRLTPELSYIPALFGNDDKPVFLYHLVEGIDEFLDFNALLAEYPTLNYSQVVGAIKFLRKVSQMNARRIDIDDEEGKFDFDDDAFLRELRTAYENRGNVARVLTDPV